MSSPQNDDAHGRFMSSSLLIVFDEEVKEKGEQFELTAMCLAY